MPDYTVTSQIVAHSSELESDWLDLQQRSECSYFQSWGWMGSWLEQIANDLHPVAIKVWFDNSLVGISLFASRNIKRRIFFRSRAMFLNEYPFEGRNMVIEYNGILAARGHEKAVNSKTVEFLLREYENYDEFHFGAIADGMSLINLLSQSTDGVDCIVNEESTSWSIDLNTINQGVNGFISSLSKNRQGAGATFYTTI